MSLSTYNIAQLWFAGGLVAATVGLVVTGIVTIRKSGQLTTAYQDQTTQLKHLTEGINAATAYFQAEQQKTLRNRQHQIINEVQSNQGLYKQWRAGTHLRTVDFARDAWNAYRDDALFNVHLTKQLQQYYQYVFISMLFAYDQSTQRPLIGAIDFFPTIQEAGDNLNLLIDQLLIEANGAPSTSDVSIKEA